MADGVLTTNFVKASEAANAIRSAVPDKQLHSPALAIVCGSGLGGLQNTIEPSSKTEIAYHDVPHFPKPTVEGHEGKLVFGYMTSSSEGGRVPVVLLVGRAHYYEGHTMDVVTFATRVCKRLGVQTMILTNAAGGLNPAYRVGDIMVLEDHLNISSLAGLNPLRGTNEPDFGVRFPPLSNAYDLQLRSAAFGAWTTLDASITAHRRLHEGVYAFVGGPSYETRAECRMLHMLGADVVGMSTVPEVIVARHAGMRVLAFSLVTNQVVSEKGVRGNDASIVGMERGQIEVLVNRGKADHEEVLLAGKEAAEMMQTFIGKLVHDMDVRLDGNS